MKKIVKALCLLLASIMSVGAFACSNGGTNEFGEKVDKSRTQLFVYNFNGGFGSEWLVAAKERYEALHAEDVYEEGKKGIQIYINPQKMNASALAASTILDNRDEVYFSEYAYYYSLKAAGVLGDITDAVVNQNAYESNKTIVSKMTEQQVDFYGIEQDGEKHFYGIPHYSGYSGIVYNKDMFDDRNYYFTDDPFFIDENNPQLDEYFIYEKTEKRTAGPDGKYDTFDDGLPRTYTEFFILCDKIYKDGNIPLTWTGSNYKDYITYFMQELVADYEGLEQTMLNYAFDGIAQNLGSFIDGNFVLDDEDTVITTKNGYELSRQAGKYYALEFVKTLVKNAKYHNEYAFNTGYSHTDAQDDFLWSGLDGKTEPSAMLIEGIWWENESKNTAKTIKTSKGVTRDYALMPLPKATESIYDEYVNGTKKNTVADYIYSICFMKSNIAEWKKPIALDFIQFCNTDESLVEFTQITNTPKALTYMMTDAQMQEMTFFGKSVYTIKATSDVVYPYSLNEIYVNNQSAFAPLSAWRSTMSIGQRTYAPHAFYEDKVSVETYFDGMYKYLSNAWSSLK